MDFSVLPDTAWVKVMRLLSLSDRASLARTCHRLNDIFAHPTVWYRVELLLLADLSERGHPGGNYFPLILPDRFNAMIERFGSFFQDLSLTILGHVTRVDEACERALVLLAKTCRLNSLTIRVGELISNNATVAKPTRQNLEVLAMVLKTAFRLQSLRIVTWPMHPDSTDFDVLACLRGNESMRQLETLGLFWRNAADSTWMPVNANLPSPASVRETVQHFSALKHLYLCSQMINDDVVLALSRSGRQSLRRLSVLVTYRQNDAVGTFFFIKEATWKSLSTGCPGVAVELVFANTVPHAIMTLLLTTSLPLSSVEFMKHADYAGNLPAYLADTFPRKLRRFADYGNSGAVSFDDPDGERPDLELEAMVSRCTELDRLFYSGPLRAGAVLRLARMRGRKWIEFSVDVESVVVDYEEFKDDVRGDDDVIGRDKDRACYVVAHRPTSSFYHTDATAAFRTEALEELKREVSEILGRKFISLERHVTFKY